MKMQSTRLKAQKNWQKYKKSSQSHPPRAQVCLLHIKGYSKRKMLFCTVVAQITLVLGTRCECWLRHRRIQVRSVEWLYITFRNALRTWEPGVQRVASRFLFKCLKRAVRNCLEISKSEYPLEISLLRKNCSCCWATGCDSQRLSIGPVGSEGGRTIPGEYWWFCIGQLALKVAHFAAEVVNWSLVCHP